MNKGENHANSQKKEMPPPPPPAAFSLRMPPPLRLAAEKYADSTGLSLNGLLCVALTDYLASRGHKVGG